MFPSGRTVWPVEPQIVMGKEWFDFPNEGEDERIEFMIPFGMALLSASILLGRKVTLRAHKERAQEESDADREDALEVQARGAPSQGLVARNGGRAIFAFMMARVLGCAGLVVLSIPPALEALLKELRGQNSGQGWHYPYLLFVNVYAFFLACVSVTSPSWRQSAVTHSITILLLELAIYVYRDLWPFATYSQHPLDLQQEGVLLWVKIALLFATAVVIPVCIPRLYVPIDPKNPSETPHPEQTASWLRFHTYSYLTPIVAAANRTKHLPASELPPLADYDRADVLMKRAEPYLNPKTVRKGRHIFFGILQLFGYDYFQAIVAMTIYPLCAFAAPVAINRLLTVLESNGRSQSDIRPWFWILSMLVCPMIGSMAWNYYIIVMTRALADSESILTQLVFDHSLKVRVKAEASSEDKKDGLGDGTQAPGEQASQGESGETGKEKTKNASSFIGRLTNLVTIDLNNVTNARDLALVFWLLPVQLIGSAVLLYIILGWSSFVGLGVMVALIPIPGYLSKLLSSVQEVRMKKTDNRTQTVTESMNVLRMIKMFGWERKIQERIDEKREEELAWIWKGKVYDLLVSITTYIIPTATMLSTYVTATLVMKMRLTSATVFSSMILFDSMRDNMYQATYFITAFVKGKVSLDRINKFLKESELLDAFEDHEETPESLSEEEDGMFGFRNATFSWNTDSSGDATPTSQFRLTVPGELQFMKGKINLIVGSTGSGKTSLLMALLGEMHFIRTHPDSAFNLPRAGGVSFSVQESWVQNETIRDNILFNSAYEEERYKKVLHQCALEQDLELFEAGDMTEVGERGLTLSGGQKARLTLARAIYSKADIILLDDVLAALDVHTAAWIVNKCLKGDLVQGRTVLLVTHNISLTSPIADFIVSVSPDGTATSRGHDIKAALLSEPALRLELEQELEAEEKQAEAESNVIDKYKDRKAAGKLIVAEEIQEGNVSWKSIRLLLKAMGGNHVALFFFVWIGATIMDYGLQSGNMWFLGYWSTQYENHPVEEVPVLRYLGIYGGLVLFLMGSYAFRDIWYILGTMRGSRTIHKLLSESILGTTLRWLDETPISRIMTRMTLDIDSVDGQLMERVNWMQGCALSMVVCLISAVIFVPLFALPGLFIALVGIWLGAQYLRAQLSVKREMSNAKAPMLAHFGAAMSGLVSLRAYGAETQYRQELRKRVDHYIRISRMNYDLNRWIGIRIDVLGALFTASLAAYLTYGSNISPANIGFSLNRAVEFCMMILYVVRIFNMLQVEANSLERITAYTEIEQEPKPTEKGKPPAAWPTSGELRVENLTARYSKTGPAVLHGLTFNVRAGERIGVVGRTGSGKSSLTLSLLRCIIVEGTVYFDGLPTSEINLDALRSNITIIPQMPELLSGTLRYNLDPFDEYDDATLNSALRASGLYATKTTDEEGRLGLDSNIASGGTNVSVGQRQIIALARAIVRSSKLLILDEATSAIDHDTDTIIQNTLRQELGPDVTVLTIAHRLQTIIDADRILVLDAGRIAEFASPAELLENPKGMFRALVDESGDKKALYEAAKRAAKGSSPTSQS